MSGSRRATKAPVALVATVQEHRHTRDSWAVAKVLVVELLRGDVPFGVAEGYELKAVGDRLGLAAPGERLELGGQWDHHPRFGLSFKVTEQVSQGVKTPAEASRWLERLDGVGPKLAGALARHFGADLPAILAGELEADLTEVHGVGADTERHIRESFAELAISGDLESVRYLDGIGASRWEGTKIMAHCAKLRRKPKELLEEAPYGLTEVKGLGFKRVDRLARKAGCPAEAPARLEAATLYQLEDIVNRGSTMAPLFSGNPKRPGLVEEAAALLALDGELVKAAVRRLAAGGQVVVAKQAGRTYVHPAPLLAAERLIYSAATGKLKRKALKAPAAADQSAEPAGHSGDRLARSLPKSLCGAAAGAGGLSSSPSATKSANGDECQGGGPGREGALTPASTSPGQAPPSSEGGAGAAGAAVASGLGGRNWEDASPGAPGDW